MINHIIKTIEELKLKVKQNVRTINRNNDAIKLLYKQGEVRNYSKQYEIYNSENQELLRQNNDFINVQLTLMNFLDRYKDSAVVNTAAPIIDIYSISDIQELFSLTIKNNIPFDIHHPQYNNVEFIDKLLAFYKEIEDYEKCQELIRLKEQLV